ncbi:MAG: PAS domain S-box protein [Candidatus Acidiferrum sp.]
MSLRTGQLPRFSIVAAVLLPLLLVLDLEFTRSPATKLLLSNSLDLAMVLLAALSSFYVARRSSGYSRQVWLLLSIAFALESLALVVSSYYQNFVPGSAQGPSPSDVLFFLWAAPVFMIFLPRSDEDAPGIDSLRVLDFLQIAIVAVTIYLYFFYSPARWQSNPHALLRQLLMVYIARDSLLSISFFFRSQASRASWLRSFSLVLALVFISAALSDAVYLFTLGTSLSSASWGDLLWMLPYFIVILLAATWKQPAPSPLSPPSPVGRLVGAQILPIAVPLLVIFLSRAIAREQLFVAWFAVTASVLCSSVRLILTSRRQRLIAGDLLATEKALHRSEQMLSTAFRNSPDAFSISQFPNGPYIEVNEGFTRLTGYSRAETLNKTPSQMNLWVDPVQRAGILDALTQTGEVRDAEMQFRTKDGRIRFGQMNASLIDLDGQRCSLVIVRDVTHRKETEEVLRSSEERFRTLVRDLHFAVVMHSPDARIEFANTAAHRMFHLPDGSAIGKLLPELGISVVDQDGKDIPQSDRPVIVVLRTGLPLYDALVGFRYPASDDILWTFGNVVPQYGVNGKIVRLISSFADVTEMKNAERSIHQLSTQLLVLQDEERRRIGRELHDGLAQTVLAVNLSLAQARQSLTSPQEAAALSLEKARALTQQMSREIRTLSYLLHPPLLDELGLVSALRDYAQGFSDRSGIDTEFLAPSGFARLPQPLELALFRIIQESLANIQRHSGSTTAQISLRRQASQVVLEVIDFGHGFTGNDSTIGSREGTTHARKGTNDSRESAIDSRERATGSRQGTASAVPLDSGNSGVSTPEVSGTNNPSNHQMPSIPAGGTPSPRQYSFGVGIPGMRERMAQIGGHLDIISGPSGTTVRATISVPDRPSSESDDVRSSHPDRG